MPHHSPKKPIIFVLASLLICAQNSLQSDDIHTSIYDGCGATKVCIGNEKTCIDERNCLSLASVHRKGTKFVFEMQSMKTFQYVAVGLSTDQRMSDDAVIECVKEDDEVKLYSSVTEVVSGNYGARRRGVPQNRTRLLNAYLRDKQVYCRVERDAAINIDNHEFNLLENDYYMMVVSGDTLPGHKLSYHPIKVLSDEMIKFSAMTEAGLSSDSSDSSVITDKIYHGCGIVKTCFGIPNNCPERGDCTSFASVTNIDGKHIFEMRSRKGASYIAIGLSDDHKMGSDSVMECVREGSSVQMYNSLTTDSPPYESRREAVPQNITKLQSNSLENDAIYCRFERVSVVQLGDNLRFDLNTNNYYLMIATGNAITSDSITQHTDRAVSSHAINFNSFENISQLPKTFINIHGSLMIVAWLGCSATSSLLPRYFKKTWRSKTLFGKDLWFALHIGLMYSTLILTILGAVIIFVDMEGLSVTLNPHWVFGIVTITLMAVQIVYAVLRPSPLSNYRKFFDISHWVVGYSAQTTATCAVYLAVTLDKSGLTSEMILYFVSFSIYYIVMHAVMYYIEYTQENDGYKPPQDEDFTDIYSSNRPKNINAQRNKKFAKIKTIVLCIFIACTAVYLSVTLWLIWSSEK